MTTQRDLVRASLDRPDYADRCAIPRRPMTPREAAHAFINAAASAAVLSESANGHNFRPARHPQTY